MYQNHTKSEDLVFKSLKFRNFENFEILQVGWDDPFAADRNVSKIDEFYIKKRGTLCQNEKCCILKTRILSYRRWILSAGFGLL